ncbi:flagellar hook-length control protein FliK [Thermodesulfovibrio hydrogeniphilus]
MISGNINLNLLMNADNVVNLQTNFSNQTSEFDILLNELLNVLSENKDLLVDNKINDLLINNNPMALFGIAILGWEQNLSQILELLKNSENKNFSLLDFIKSGENSGEIFKLLQKIQTENKSNPSFEKIADFENIIKLNSKNLENTDLQKLTEKLTNQDLKLADDSLKITKSFSATEIKNENSANLIKLLNEENAINLSDKTTSNNVKQEHLTSPSNTSDFAPKLNDIQTKIDLPITRLNDVSSIIFKAVSTSQKNLIVQLEPPELGRILIKLSLDNGSIKADMKVDYPHVKEMLTALVPEIKSNLQSSGIKVSDFLLDLTKEHKGYSDSYQNQGNRKNRDNQKFIEYFA